MNTREKLDNWLSRRYDYLNGVAGRIGKRKGDDLLSHLVDWLYSGHPMVDKLLMKSESDLEAYSVQFLSRSFHYKNSAFNSQEKIFSQVTFDDELFCEEDNIVMHKSLIEPEFEIIEDNYKEELFYMGFNNHQVKIILEAQSRLSKLNTSMKVLYRMYFEDMMTQREIAKIKKIPYSSCYELIKQLKIELRKN